MPEVLTTAALAARDRFGFWREAVCDSYVQLDCHSPHPEWFHGEIQLYRMSQIAASFVSGSEQKVRRRKRDIGRASEASFLISLQLRNSGMIEQGGRIAHLQEGDFALYSSIDPYELMIPNNFQQLVIQIPRDRLLDRLPNADLLTAKPVRGTSDIGDLVKNSILGLVGAIEQTNNVARVCLQDTIVDLMATGLATLHGGDLQLSLPERQHMIRAKAFITDNLKDSDLCRASLATHLGISVRRLSEVFEADGKGIAATIRETRLQRIAADLEDARYAGLSISEIAIKWGIRNLQHFPRMFREQYGMSPRDYQRQSRKKLLH